MDKKDKLAAARKKLEEYKKNKGTLDHPANIHTSGTSSNGHSRGGSDSSSSINLNHATHFFNESPNVTNNSDFGVSSHTSYMPAHSPTPPLSNSLSTLISNECSKEHHYENWPPPSDIIQNYQPLTISDSLQQPDDFLSATQQSMPLTSAYYQPQIKLPTNQYGAIENTGQSYFVPQSQSSFVQNESPHPAQYQQNSFERVNDPAALVPPLSDDSNQSKTEILPLQNELEQRQSVFSLGFGNPTQPIIFGHRNVEVIGLQQSSNGIDNPAPVGNTTNISSDVTATTCYSSESQQSDSHFATQQTSNSQQSQHTSEEMIKQVERPQSSPLPPVHQQTTEPVVNFQRQQMTSTEQTASAIEIRSGIADPQEHIDVNSVRMLRDMKGIQEALELQLEGLRQDNERLLTRQSELVSQVENNERTLQEVRKERDRSKDEAKKLMQPLQIKINSLFEENQALIKKSADVESELKQKLDEKAKQFEDMEQAFIIVSQSKMEFAAELDQEREKWREYEHLVHQKDACIQELQDNIIKLEEQLKSSMQKEAIIGQLEDQRKHFQVQTETLQGELEHTKEKMKMLEQHKVTDNVVHRPHEEHNHAEQHDDHEHSHSCDHSHPHSHGHDHHHNRDEHHEQSDDHQNHEYHDHAHSQCSGHGHSHGTNEDNDRHSEHGSSHSDGSAYVDKEMVVMRKKLHRLEWENNNFQEEIDRLVIDAKEKIAYEKNYLLLKEESDSLRVEVLRLEHLVIQLQGENDTIGDYITLYQSQRLALKERAKEKDAQIESLAKEREQLIHKLSELNQLMKQVKMTCTHNEAHNVPSASNGDTCEHEQAEASAPKQDQLEGKILNLISEISSSSLMENYHPCSVCSGRLMTV